MQEFHLVLAAHPSPAQSATVSAGTGEWLMSIGVTQNHHIQSAA